MAHNLATIRSRVAMAYRGELPWHKLGQRLTDGCSLQDAIEAASLGYTVSLAPLYLGDGRLVTDRQAVLRDSDVILGTVGKGYEVVQNCQAFDIVEALLGVGGMDIETAGALGQGEVAWLMLRNHADIKVGGTDTVKPYLLVVTSHDGTRAVQAIPTAIRVVCNNTLNMVRERCTISIRHTASAGDKMLEAKRILGQFAKAKQAAEVLYDKMANTPLSLDQLADYWQAVFPVSRTQDETDESRLVVSELLNGGQDRVMSELLSANGEKSTNAERQEIVQYLLESGRGAAGQTAWGAYNAVTEYVDHVYVARQDGTYRTHGAQSALFGGGSIIRDKAWKAATALVN